jgi:signal transduction histidine kinase
MVNHTESVTTPSGRTLRESWTLFGRNLADPLPTKVRGARWITASFAFAAIIAVLLAATLVLRHQLQTSRGEIERIAQEGKSVDQSVDAVLLRLSEVAITARELVVARQPQTILRREAELRESADSLRQSITDFSSGTPEEFRSDLAGLQGIVLRYLSEVDRLLSLPADQRLEQGTTLTNQMMRPLRQTLATELSRVKAAQDRRFDSRRRQLLATYDNLDHDLLRFGILIVLLVSGIACYAVLRLRRLEEHSYHQSRELGLHRDELRKLSQGLVEAQESERNRLSRELHDEVGQMLTALRMEIGNLRGLHERNDPAFQERWVSAKQLGDQLLQAVRDISMGLRPSMLDDLGLEPAIRWQARDFARRSGIDVDVSVEGNLNLLPEKQRTYAYRIVQEGLTNIARHAHAQEVLITAQQSDTRFRLTIRDNGRGFEAGRSSNGGAGLLGIRERVQELGGSCEIQSQPSKGTVIRIEIPLEEQHAHV